MDERPGMLVTGGAQRIGAAIAKVLNNAVRNRSSENNRVKLPIPIQFGERSRLQSVNASTNDAPSAIRKNTVNPTTIGPISRYPHRISCRRIGVIRCFV